MSSETGLKRRIVPSSAGAGGGGGGSSSDGGNRGGNMSNDNPDADKNNSDNDDQNEEFDADSKSTRLTLMEEILLLGLKDKEVSGKPIRSKIFQSIDKQCFNLIRFFLFKGLYLVLE